MQVGTKAGNDAHEGTQGGGSAQGQVGAAGGGLSLAELMESGLEEVRGMGNAGDDSKLSAPADAGVEAEAHSDKKCSSHCHIHPFYYPLTTSTWCVVSSSWRLWPMPCNRLKLSGLNASLSLVKLCISLLRLALWRGVGTG
eukprot:scaffold138880_cov21-Tisochrysis_lutea.AAC.1